MNAVIYARYSSSSQTEQSIEGQLRVCHEYAARKGLSVINEYIDRATTGTNDNRPAFLQMISDAEQKQFEVIIVYKLDRFSRNKYESVVYKHKLKQVNVKVESATENISDSPEGVLLEGLLEMFAEMYSKDLSQKVKRGIKESIIKGNYIGGHVLYGYKVENKKLVINEETAPAVRYMFEQYAKGVPKKQIIQELNNKGYRNRNGKIITINTFQNNLRNTKYAGIYEKNEIINNEYYPAIVSKEIFKKVQNMLDKNKHAPATQKAKEKYLLTGKCFCGHCGAKMVGISGTSHTNKRHRYYTCYNHWKYKNCNKQNELKDKLEEDVVKDTLEYVLNPNTIDEIVNKVFEEMEKKPISIQIKESEKRLSLLDKEIDKMFDMLIKTDCEELKVRIKNKSKELEILKIDLKADLQKLKVSNLIKMTKENLRKSFEMYLEKCDSEEEYKRKIINQFVNCVYVFDNNDYLIYYNFPTDDLVTFEDMQNDLKNNSMSLTPRQSNVNAVRISSDMPRQKKLIRKP